LSATTVTAEHYFKLSIYSLTEPFLSCF